MLPDRRVVMLPVDSVVMLPERVDLRVVMLPAKVVAEIETTRTDALRRDLNCLIVFLLVNKMFTGSGRVLGTGLAGLSLCPTSFPSCPSLSTDVPKRGLGRNKH